MVTVGAVGAGGADDGEALVDEGLATEVNGGDREAGAELDGVAGVGGCDGAEELVGDGGRGAIGPGNQQGGRDQTVFQALQARAARLTEGRAGTSVGEATPQGDGPEQARAKGTG